MFCMANKILLTSFDTWLPHQKSNSSDDLLIELSKLAEDKFCHFTLSSLTLLRQLPVDIELASCCVIPKINELQPDSIICCGMAERRLKLSVESNANCGTSVLKTLVNLNELVAGLDGIEISYDAGKFVCEGLYYSILKYLRDRDLNTPCIFVHVPILTQEKFAEIITNFLLITQRMAVL